MSVYNAFEDQKIGREDHVAAMMGAFNADIKPDCVPHSNIDALERRIDRLYEMFEEAVQFRDTRTQVAMKLIPNYPEIMIETHKRTNVVKH